MAIQPPEWTGWPLIGALPSLLANPAEFCLRAARRFPGALIRIRVGPSSFLLPTDPTQIEHIVLRNETNYWKGPLLNTLDPLFGRGLVLSEGARWRHHRRLIQPAFQKEKLRSLIPAFQEIVHRATHHWKPGSVVDIEATMRQITLQIILRAMFSSSLSTKSTRTIERTLERVVNIFPLVAFTWTWPKMGRVLLRRIVSRMNREIYAAIASQRGCEIPPDDLLSRLLDARDIDGTPLDDDAIRDHIATMIFGGYEATATALYWLWILLDRHPSVRTRVYQECEQADRIENLNFSSHVIDESLRIYPPFWETFRTAHESDEICGYSVEPGASILISPYVVHRDPRLWKAPERFDPGRFESGTEPVHPFAYIPFLRGQRMCIGKHFAAIEMLIVLQCIARTWVVELEDPSWKLATQAHASLRPRGAPRMRIRARREFF